MATPDGVPAGSDDPAPSTEQSPEPALQVEGLSKRFGSVTAVEDVSLTIEQGSVVGLLGPNGAGKTTTIKCILGMVLPDEGTARVFGTDVLASPRQAYRHVDAMLEGARNDYWRLTVRENLRYFTVIKGTDPDSLADRHERLLDKLDLSEKADTAVRDLSRGMKQKVSLASVLASEADLVFLDEPTLGLDVESSLTLRQELRRIVDERDMTIVLSSHDMAVVEDVCDRVVIMRDGQVVADDAVSKLRPSGAERTYRVTSPDLTPSLVATLRGRFDIVAVDRGGVPSVDVAADSEGFYELAAVLRERDVRLDGVTTVESDLEDVFLRLTDGERT